MRKNNTWCFLLCRILDYGVRCRPQADEGLRHCEKGAVVEEAEGSRITVDLNNIVAVFHRPHPRKETDKGAVKSVRRFLVEAGVKHD